MIQALTYATGDVIYRMSPDWTFMHELDGHGFLRNREALGGGNASCYARAS